MSGKESKGKSTNITSVKTVAESSLPPHQNNSDTDIIRAELHQLEMHSGPVPHPEILRQYDEIVPGAANRIIELAEREASHRHECDDIIIKTEKRDSLLGIISATLLCVATIIAGVAIALNVPSTAGTVMGSLLGASGLASVFGAMVKTTRTSWQINTQDVKNSDDKNLKP